MSDILNTRIVFCLATCDTCKRILKELDLSKNGFELREIKSKPITEIELLQMKELAGSYSSLFSKTARKYKELQLAQKNLTEEEIRNYILSDYTFLKRPVIIAGKSLFAGNSPKVISEAKALIFG